MTSENGQTLYRRKRLRLPAALYDETGLRALITITTRERFPSYADPMFARECLDHLRRQSEEQNVAILAYTFLPDHVHLLLRIDGSVGIVDFIRKFKSVTTRLWWTHGNTGRLWQRTFHDHLLRDNDDDSEYVKYVMMNPIKAGLAANWGEHHFTGSLALDLSDGIN